MNKQLRLLTLLCLIFWRCSLSVAVPCSPGERLHTPRDAETGDVCILCDNGTFMAERDHKHRECYNCSIIENPEIETLITECNRSHDTTVGCIPGYYRLEGGTVLDKDTCVECRKCESGFPARPCQGYNDTVCCPLYHDAVLTSQGTIECWERPTCEAGMYYNTSLRGCLSCPYGTYMQARDHTNLACIKCETLSGNTSNHAAIQQPCSRTSPTIFGCEEFHFRVSNTTSMLEEVPCRPCRKCRLEVKNCGIHDDAVCAPDGENSMGQVADVTTKTSDAPSESSARKCLKDRLFEIDKIDEASVWLQAALCIVLSVLISSTVFCMPKNLATCSFGNRCLNCRQFTCMLFIFNIFNSSFIILKACLETKIFENRGYFFITTTAVCYILPIFNLALVLFFVRKARPKNLRRRNESKDAHKRHNEDTEETQQFVSSFREEKRRHLQLESSDMMAVYRMLHHASNYIVSHWKRLEVNNLNVAVKLFTLSSISSSVYSVRGLVLKLFDFVSSLLPVLTNSPELL